MDDVPTASRSDTPGPRFEFGVRENDVIGGTGRWVTWWGWISMAAGVLLIAGGVSALREGGISQLVLGGIYVLVGVYFRGAGRSLGRVVETTGDDVAHLMEALERLTSAFQVQVILVIVGVALVFVAGITMAVAGN